MKPHDLVRVGGHSVLDNRLAERGRPVPPCPATPGCLLARGGVAGARALYGFGPPWLGKHGERVNTMSVPWCEPSADVTASRPVLSPPPSRLRFLRLIRDRRPPYAPGARRAAPPSPRGPWCGGRCGCRELRPAADSRRGHRRTRAPVRSDPVRPAPPAGERRRFPEAFPPGKDHRVERAFPCSRCPVPGARCPVRGSGPKPLDSVAPLVPAARPRSVAATTAGSGRGRLLARRMPHGRLPAQPDTGNTAGTVRRCDVPCAGPPAPAGAPPTGLY